jgi:hypothetical protein
MITGYRCLRKYVSTLAFYQTPTSPLSLTATAKILWVSLKMLGKFGHLDSNAIFAAVTSLEYLYCVYFTM